MTAVDEKQWEKIEGKGTCMGRILKAALIPLMWGYLWAGNGYYDAFPAGGAQLHWQSAWEDSSGNALTPLEVTDFNSPSGDNSVGIVTVDTATLGGLGMAYGGSPDLRDYSVEAWVYVTVNSGFYQAIMTRIDTSNGGIVGYQFAANFYVPFFTMKLKFRKWNQSSGSIVTLAEWSGNDIPGGAPSTDGWHKMKLVSIGNDHYCYWDDQLVGGGPVQDTTANPIESGYYGVYVWDMFSSTPASIMVDDFNVRLTDFQISDDFAPTGPRQYWSSAWFDTAGTALTPMQVTDFNSPSGDNSVGIVTVDTATLGGLGMAYGGSPGMADYSIEAWVYVTVNSGYYQAIMTRIDTSGGGIEGYQFAANFYVPFFAMKLKFRKWNQSSGSIVNLAEWSGNDIPGGAPSTDGWHKMKLVSVGPDHYCYWDDQLVGGGPVQDTTGAPIDSGYYGVYVWDMFSATPASIMVDDILVQPATGGTAISGPSTAALPLTLSLGANYPNPFNPSTVIPYALSRSGHVQLDIFDLNGRRITTLVRGDYPAAQYRVTWDGRDENGRPVPAGVYLYRLKTPDQSLSRRMILLK